MLFGGKLWIGSNGGQMMGDSLDDCIVVLC